MIKFKLQFTDIISKKGINFKSGVGIYGVIYAAVTTVLMPQDLNEFKTELDATSQNQISNSDITKIESAAATMESSH